MSRCYNCKLNCFTMNSIEFLNMKDKALRTFNFLEKNLIVIVASLAILISPFVVDYSNLPKGYELPKVSFLNAMSVVIILLGAIKYIEVLYRTKKFRVPKDFIIFAILMIIFIFSTLVSPHFNLAVYGNSFRDQGLITHALIVASAYVVYKSISRRNFVLLAVAFVLSSILQSGAAYVQVVKLIQTDPQSILDGYWVNGTFGQANFFSGRLLLGLIFSTYFIGENLGIKFAWFFKTLLLLATLFIVGALLLSLSIWGIVTAAAAIVLILIYELFPKKFFPYFFFLVAAIATIGGVYYIYQTTEYNLRLEIWKNLSKLIFTQALPKNMILGYGFDTLGQGFKDWAYFKGVLIDRAHNFFLDVLFQVGVAGLTIVSIILVKPIIEFRKKADDRKFTFAFFALFFWLFRSFVHESGITNLYDFLIVLGMALALMKSNEKVEVITEEVVEENLKEFEEIADETQASEVSSPDILSDSPVSEK